MQKTIIIILLLSAFILIGGFTQQRLFRVETIETSLSPDQLWNLVTKSLEDSSTSLIWPTEYEEVRSQLGVGNTINVTYKTPFGASKQTYTITDIRYGVLEYKTSNSHPLQGKGVITVIPRPQGSALSWSLDYSYKTFNPAGWYVKYLFAPSFFSSLKNNLKKADINSIGRY
jgi:hypothetical protein